MAGIIAKAIIAKPFAQTPYSIVRPHIGGLKVRESWPVDRFVAKKLEWPPVGRQYRILIDVVDRYRTSQSSPRPMKMIPCSLNCVTSNSCFTQKESSHVYDHSILQITIIVCVN